MRGAFFESGFYHDDEVTVSFRYRKALAVLFFLLAEKRPVARQELVRLLWPDAEDARAKNAFRVVLTDIRQNLGDVLESDRHTITLRNVHSVESDLAEFSEWVRTGAALGKQPPVPITTPILASLKFEDAPEFVEWIESLQERVRRTGVDALIALSDAALREGRDDEAIAALRDALTLCSWDESTHRRLIRLLITLGHVTEAEQQINTCKLEIRRHFDAAPSQAIVELENEISHVPSREPLMPPMPMKLRGIVGRASEIQSVERAFRDDGARIVILSGLPGVGTSSIAWAATRTLAPRFLGRVKTWSAAEVASESEFAFHFEALDSGKEDIENLILVDDVPNLAWLRPALGSQVKQNPLLHLIVTGRGAVDPTLGVNIKVNGLPLPDPSRPENHAVATTLALRPFAATDAGTEALCTDPLLARLVCRTGGHPPTLLALGNLISRFGLADVDANLERLLHEQVSEDADTATFAEYKLEEALNLLPEEARASLHLLSVFRGPFEQSVARRVTNIDESALVRSLQTLQSHNWIEAFPTERGMAAFCVAARAGLHLRQHSALPKPLLAAHANWITNELERAHVDVLRHDQQQVFSRIQRSLDDVDAALDYLEATNQGEEAIRAASKAWRFQDMANRSASALQRLDRLLETYGELCDPLLRSDGLHARGSLLLKLGRLDASRDAYEMGLALRRKAGDVNRIVSSLNNLAVIDGMTGAFSDAAARFLEVSEKSAENGEVWVSAAALVNRGHALTELGDYPEALRAYRSGSGQMKAIGDQLGQLSALIGVIHSAAACDEDSLVASSVIEFRNQMGAPGGIPDITRLELPVRVAAEKLRTLGYPNLAPKLESTLDAHLFHRRDSNTSNRRTD